MKPQYSKHERVLLRGNPDFSEAWVHDRIKDDPSVLGLGDLTLLRSERTQQAGGRLDILLADTENEVWYETEVMLGPTDPSHIIRCIEYWDVERRRYPAYEHVAVLIAEDVTARFLNVMSLLAGSIPLVAIQLNALRIKDQIILHFVKVLDQRELRTDVVTEGDSAEATRDMWDARVGIENMKICDRILEFSKVVNPQLELKYKKSHVGLCEPGSVFNIIVFFPKKSYVPCRMILSDAEQAVVKADEAGFEADQKKGNRVLFKLRPEDVTKREPELRAYVEQTLREQG